MSESQAHLEEPPRQSPAVADGAWVDLEHYKVTGYEHRSLALRMLWYAVSLLFFESGLPIPSGWKCGLLRWFGGRVGRGVVIKPNVRIKFPWQLAIGDHVWVGQGSWFDNFAEVRLGSHVCISQGVYFCTGSHDHRKRSFDLVTRPIAVEDGAWVAARSTLLGGVTVGANALVAAASMVHKDVAPGMMVGGNPEQPIGLRQPPT